MELDAAVRAGGWLARQSPALRAALLREGRPIALDPGQWLHGEGDEGGGVAIVLAGALRLMVAVADGAEAVLDVAGPGTVFGQTPSFGGGPRLVTAIAAEPARVLHIPDRALQRIAADLPEVWRALSELLYGQLSRSIRLSAQFIGLPAVPRLAARLGAVARANRLDPRAWIPLSQAELAQMTALSRKTVNGILRRWRREGLVDTRYRAIRVLRPDRLATIAARP